MPPGLDSEQTRLRLLTAAAEEVLERGYTGASLARIGQRLGLTKGALSHHFPTKGSLVGGLIDHSIDVFPLIVSGATSAFPTSPVRACVALLGGMAAASHLQPVVGAAILLFQDPSVDPALVAPLREGMGSALADLLRAAEETEGYTLTMDVEDAVQFLQVLLAGFLSSARFPATFRMHHEPLFVATVLGGVGITDSDVVVADVMRALATG